MRKIIMSGLFAIALVGIAFAMDIDRHADFSNPKAQPAAAGCKGFYGTDDNRTACDDFCGQYRTANDGATCECGEGKCAADEHP
ncbi:MAG TPA: hypothetical protein VKR28_05100 [Candidatus Binatus sp.]|nr:hypothetical protein [Candidatus Binatus sp.]